VSSSSYTETNIRSASGRKGQFDIHSGYRMPYEIKVKPSADRERFQPLPKARRLYSGQTTITVSETNVVRILTNEAKNAVTTLQTASSFTVRLPDCDSAVRTWLVGICGG